MPLSKQEILDKAENFKGAVGLIQFTEIAIKALNQNFNLNLTKRKLALMSPTEQLSYVEHYFKLGDAYKKIQRGDDIYLHVFAPKGVGKPDDYVLYRKNDPKHPEYYSENASVDYDSNSLITNSEILSRLHQSINDGSANDNRSDFKDHEVIEHTYSVVSYEESKQRGEFNKSECKDGCSLRNSSTLSAGDKKWAEPLDRMVLRTAALASPRGAMFGMTRNGGTKPHQGIDIVAEVGKTPVKAVAKGKITTVFSSSTYGNVVVLAVGLDDLPQKQKQAFEQYRTNTSQIAYFFYAHLHSINVQQNAEVSAGVQIAIAGNTGSTAVSCRTIETGSHLHFEVRDKDGIFAGMRNRLDPKYFLNIQYPRNFNP